MYAEVMLWQSTPREQIDRAPRSVWKAMTEKPRDIWSSVEGQLEDDGDLEHFHDFELGFDRWGFDKKS